MFNNVAVPIRDRHSITLELCTNVKDSYQHCPGRVVATNGYHTCVNPTSYLTIALCVFLVMGGSLSGAVKSRSSGHHPTFPLSHIKVPTSR